LHAPEETKSLARIRKGYIYRAKHGEHDM